MIWQEGTPWMLPGCGMGKCNYLSLSPFSWGKSIIEIKAREDRQHYISPTHLSATSRYAPHSIQLNDIVMKVFTLFAFDENDISTNQQTYLILYVWTEKKFSRKEKYYINSIKWLNLISGIYKSWMKIERENELLLWDENKTTKFSLIFIKCL